jgi:hypothetical protein
MPRGLFQSFWHGPHLSPLEHLCICTFLDAGHEFCLYAYDEVGNVPRTCRVEDAATIVPRDELFLHREGIHVGSIGAFSDLFRYRLLLERGGWWADTDVVCLGLDHPETEYVFAEQEPGVVNGAILKAPAGSPFVAEACARATAAGSDAAFASVGPKLLTQLVVELGLGEHAWPSSSIYPIGWDEALHALDPARRGALVECSRDSYFFHLWSEMLTLHNVLKTVRPPEGSYLAMLYDRYDIEFPTAPRYEFSHLRAQIWLHERHRRLREELTSLYERIEMLKEEGAAKRR